MPPREFGGPGAKKKHEAPESEASRKFSGSRNQLQKNTVGILHEVPWTFKH